jgi:SAM-dependent methyltransferase
LKLNLGSCDRHFPGFVAVDIVPPADVIADLNERWPWEDSSIDEIRAWDLLEHLKTPIHSMNEGWRVLRPGGRFDIQVPTTDGRGWAQDPGHVCWPPFNRNSFFYYEHGNPHLTRFAPMNGVRCAFRIVHDQEQMLTDHVSKLHIILEAVKP